MSTKTKQDGPGYIWLPIPPDGYKAVGSIVTTSPNKPSLDKIQCVRSDLTDTSETNKWIWGPGSEINPMGFNVFTLQPSKRGRTETGVSVGTFIAQDGGTSSSLSISCLKNSISNLSSMPNLNQIKALLQAYSPWIYFHPKEIYLPSSVNWFFQNGALLYSKEDEANPVPIEPNGSNLPQGGQNDGTYWLGLPVDKNARERVMKGDLGSSEAYVHVKPMLGGSFTDIAMWVFCPFNGPAIAKLGAIDIPLGKIGQHVGDWEHVTLRISNFNGVLSSAYFSEHSGGTWIESSSLEFQGGGNKPVAYSSLHGHAFYPKAGLVLQGGGKVGIRNDTARSDKVLDCGEKNVVVSAEHLGGEIVEPPWLNYTRKWGPNIDYDLGVEVKKVEGLMDGRRKSALESLIKVLPNEVRGEEGPTGPKMKKAWDGDEV